MTFLLKLFSGLWGYIATALGAIAAVAGIYLAGKQSGKAAVRVKASEKARSTEKKATKALTKGMQREQTELDAARARRRKRLRECSK